MSRVKVIYINKSAGLVEDFRLYDLIARGTVAAFCTPKGWVGVTGERKADPVAGEGSSGEMGRIEESALQ